MNIKSQEFRSGVVISVIASIVVIIFIQPILSFLWGLTLEFAPSAFEYMLNSVYQNAALGQRDWVVGGFSLIVLGVGASIAFTAALLRILSCVFRPDQIKSAITNGRRKVHPLAQGAMDFIGGCAFLILAVSIFADLQMNTSFNHRLTILKPHISDHEEEVLMATWATMQKRQDYLDINKKMDEMAKLSGLSLPGPMMK